MHEIEYKILINEPLTEDIFEMVLDGDTRAGYHEAGAVHQYHDSREVPQAADQCL